MSEEERLRWVIAYLELNHPEIMKEVERAYQTALEEGEDRHG